MALSKDMAASLSTSRYKEMGGEVRTEWTARVHVPKRSRPLNERTVAEIEESIDQVGLLQPIGVKAGGPDDYHTTLIFGAHRHEAWRRKFVAAEASGERDEIERWQMIPVIVYPADMPDSLSGAVEIMENLLRQDLSREERQAFAGRYGKWLREQGKEEVSTNGANQQVSTNGANHTPKPKGGPKADPWFKTWYSGANIPKNTAENWWNDFLAKTEREKVTPGKAEQPLRNAFFAWLEAQETEKAAAAAEAEEKARVEEASKARARRADVFRTAAAEVFENDGESALLDLVRQTLPDRKIVVT